MSGPHGVIRTTSCFGWRAMAALRSRPRIVRVGLDNRSALARSASAWGAFPDIGLGTCAISVHLVGAAWSRFV